MGIPLLTSFISNYVITPNINDDSIEEQEEENVIICEFMESNRRRVKIHKIKKNRR
jgi:hypothetical protein